MANQFIAFNEGHFTLAADRLKCGNPQLLNASEHTDPSEAVIGAFGIPFDCGQFTNQGTSKAPGVVRELSNLYCSYQYPHDEIYEVGQVFDGGNFVPEDPSASIKDCLMSLKEQVKAQLARGTFRPVFIGGDHTIPYATIAALSEHLGKPISLIHIDAHWDFNNSGDNDFIDDSTFLYDMIKMGYVDPARTTQLYIRYDLHSFEPNELIERTDVVDARAMKEHYLEDRFSTLVKQIEEKKGSEEPVYILLDIDALDMTNAPGTTFPMPGGASNDEIIQLFYQLSQTHMNFYGGEVVEVIPDLNTPTKTTCGMAANILRDMAILAWKAAKRR